MNVCSSGLLIGSPLIDRSRAPVLLDLEVDLLELRSLDCLSFFLRLWFPKNDRGRGPALRFHVSDWSDQNVSFLSLSKCFDQFPRPRIVKLKFPYMPHVFWHILDSVDIWKKRVSDLCNHFKPSASIEIILQVKELLRDLFQLGKLHHIFFSEFQEVDLCNGRVSFSRDVFRNVDYLWRLNLELLFLLSLCRFSHWIRSWRRKLALLRYQNFVDPVQIEVSWLLFLPWLCTSSSFCLF